MIRSTALALLATASAAFAGPIGSSMSMPSPAPMADSLFAAGFVLSPYALFLTPDAEYDDVFGGGIAADYYFNEFIGLGASASWADVEGTADGDDGIGGVYTGNLTVRYPIGHFAPYVIGGVGFENFGGNSEFTGFGGAGVQVQFTQQFGLFGDWLYNFPGGGGGDDDLQDFQMIRAGVRIGF